MLRDAAAPLRQQSAPAETAGRSREQQPSTRRCLHNRNKNRDNRDRARDRDNLSRNPLKLKRRQSEVQGDVQRQNDKNEEAAAKALKGVRQTETDSSSGED